MNMDKSHFLIARSACQGEHHTPAGAGFKVSIFGHVGAISTHAHYGTQAHTPLGVGTGTGTGTR